jgi:putative membrane protein
MRRFVRWLVVVALFDTIWILFLSWLIPGLTVDGYWGAFTAAIVVAVVNVVAWPFIYSLSTRLSPILFPIACLFLTGVAMLLIAPLIEMLSDSEFYLHGIGAAIWFAVGITVGNTLAGAVAMAGDEFAYERFVVQPLRNSYRNDATHSEEPGFLFVEIDGLAEPVLRQAIDRGDMPTVERWLEEGNYRMMEWEPDLSSQTSASQAGILLGDNTDIPAFRWYDKAAGKVMVSSKMSTAKTLESRLSTGDGLLAPNGGSRWNVFSGDADDCVVTFSTFGDRSRHGSTSYLAYFTNPYTLSRAIALYIADVFRELYEARRQRWRNEQPRIHRTLRYAFVRAATTTLMQEAGLFMLLSDAFRGLPAVYCTLFSYDEVAHHSGIDRVDAFKVLKTVDQLLAILERAVADAPRPYRIVVLSDHGQSLGATFRQRYGKTLAQVVDELTASHLSVRNETQFEEEWGNLNLAVSEAIQLDNRTTRLARRALQSRMQGDEVRLEPNGRGKAADKDASHDEKDVVVLASGNLGLISFTGKKDRLNFEQLSDEYPDLLPGLRTHPGISFILVCSETDGGLVLGPSGGYYLDHGYGFGDNPLAHFEPTAIAHLQRTNGFTNAPDILVMSCFDPSTQQVAAFEELVGSHGGLGGPQTQPFVLYPSTLNHAGKPVVGAASLNHLFKEWIAGAQNKSEGKEGAPVASTYAE